MGKKDVQDEPARLIASLVCSTQTIPSDEVARSIKKPDGTPEPATIRLGQEIERLRKNRRMSRSQLVSKLYQRNELEVNDKIYDTSWLARLETGRVVKVTRRDIELMCGALECKPGDRDYARLLLFADRSFCETPDPVAEMLYEVMIDLYTRDREYLHRMLDEEHAPSTKQKMRELIKKALERTR
jgi:DNA-binding Xre family transcriptional regulator